jgi:hypothetical protein
VVGHPCASGNRADSGIATTPVAGRVRGVNGVVVRFTPLYPLDPGRTYDVVFDPRAAGVPAIAGIAGKSGRVTVPAAPDTAPPTTVSAVYPGTTDVPANLLRMYIEFSAPMGSRDGQNYVAILDAQGRDMQDAVLPLDTGLWNPDHTRFTVLFDPGRVKRGILPNRRADVRSIRARPSASSSAATGPTAARVRSPPTSAASIASARRSNGRSRPPTGASRRRPRGRANRSSSSSRGRSTAGSRSAR